MKREGIYYLPECNKIWVVVKVDYYEDLFNPPFAIIDCYSDGRLYRKCLIEKHQFKKFKRIGEL
jgi:hypothetical protein